MLDTIGGRRFWGCCQYGSTAVYFALRTDSHPPSRRRAIATAVLERAPKAQKGRRPKKRKRLSLWFAGGAGVKDGPPSARQSRPSEEAHNHGVGMQVWVLMYRSYRQSRPPATNPEASKVAPVSLGVSTEVGGGRPHFTNGRVDLHKDHRRDQE